MAALPKAPELVTISTPGGARFRVAKTHQDQFQGLVNDLEAGGYVLNPKTSGGFNSRYIAGTQTPSEHAYGRAIDVNWDENPRGARGKIPADVARALAVKHGMTWGGDWKNPDDMHFEIRRSANTPPMMAARSARGEYGAGQAGPDVPAMAADSARGEYGADQTPLPPSPDPAALAAAGDQAGQGAADYAALSERYKALAAAQAQGSMGDAIANLVKAGQAPAPGPEPILQRTANISGPLPLAQRLR